MTCGMSARKASYRPSAKSVLEAGPLGTSAWHIPHSILPGGGRKFGINYIASTSGTVTHSSQSWE